LFVLALPLEVSVADVIIFGSNLELRDYYGSDQQQIMEIECGTPSRVVSGTK
jgi:hypothetical protein